MLREAVLNRIRRELNGKPLVVEGANGSLGLSLAKVLAELEIDPSAILLTTHTSSPSTEWSRWGQKVTSIKSFSKSYLVEHQQWMDSQPSGIFVVYGAGYGRPSAFMKDTAAVVEANTGGLLRYGGSSKISFFAYLSSSELYTGNEGVAEESAPLVSTPKHERSVYIEAKRLGEALVRHVLSRTVKRAVCYRIALAAAPKLMPSDDRVLADLLRGATQDRKVVLKGGSSLIRQYQYGPNAIYKLLGSMVNGTADLYINAGSHVYTLGQLAELIAKIFNAELDIRPLNLDQSSPKAVLLATGLIDRESGYLTEKEKSFEQYLMEIVSNAPCKIGTT